jgi:putative Holliday junction resolvase
MRTLAIDHGQKRTGLAMSDAGGKFASPLEVVPTDGSLISKLLAVIKEEGVERIVIGLPMHMEGGLGSTAKSVLAFAKELEAQSKLTPIFVDERLSSFDAEQQLIDRKRAGGKMTRAMKKERLDALAACAFLQGFLDEKLTAIDPKKV